jgi:mono/diheme cytochrome c family protein
MKRILEKLNRYFCGAFRLAVLDENAGRWVVNPDPTNIAYLKAENANGRHILIQPFADRQPFYLLADDVTPYFLDRHHRYRDGAWRPGRMVIETSPNNYQVWIHSSRFVQLEAKRYWLKKLHSDPGADPDDRARAYLHTNCAQCHRPGGPTPSTMDLRYTTALSATNACNATPLQGRLGNPNALLIAPGEPSNSLVIERMTRRDIHGMPPLGSTVVDTAGVTLLTNWINGLATCN